MRNTCSTRDARSCRDDHVGGMHSNTRCARRPGARAASFRPSAPARFSRLGAATPAVPAAAAEEVRQDAVLRRWIHDHGGFVHDAISISSATECGSRGLVASAAIDLAQLEARSLVVVPRHLHLDNAAAVAAIGPRLGSGARREAFASLGQLQQVACCLASERARGQESFWRPYLATLPASPPNPWLLTGPPLAAALEEAAEGAAAAAAAEAEAASSIPGQALSGQADELDEQEEEELAVLVGDSGAWRASSGREPGRGGLEHDCAGWGAAVEAARRRYGALASEVLEVAGPDAASLGLEQEGLMWALGQVVSRSLGSGRSSGLLPFIDMANHHPGSRPPMMMLDERDQIVFALTSIRDGELAPLAAGQELCIDYNAEGMGPLKAWLKWGFVPLCSPRGPG